MKIRDNFLRVKENVAKAAIKSGRNPEDITIIGVTKYSTIDDVCEAKEAGLCAFAENRVQLLKEKQADPRLAYPENDWHLIGHLQTNKVKDVVGRVSLIHSVDSIHLARSINNEAKKQGIIMPFLLELNISGEKSKYGMCECDIPQFIDAMPDFTNLRLNGLMTMAPLDSNLSEQSRIFSKIHNIYVDMKKQTIYNVVMSYLSVGMSNDYEVAIAEGSNMVRIGRQIFK